MRPGKKDLVVARELSERGSQAPFDRTNGRPPDVSENEALYTGSPRRTLHGAPIEMPPDRTAKVNRPGP